MASFLDEPHFIIGMEIVFDSQLEEALDAFSIYDRSSEAGSGYTLEDRASGTGGGTGGGGGSIDGSGTTLNNLEDDGSSSSDDSDEEDTTGDNIVHQAEGPGDEIDDELMARLTSAYIDTDSEDSDDDEDDGSDSSSDSDDASWRKDDTKMQQKLLGVSTSSRASSLEQSLNTNIAVMLDTSLAGSSTQGQLSLSSRGGLGNNNDRREHRRRRSSGCVGPTTGRSRRHKGTRSRTNSPGPASDRRMKDLTKDTTTPATAPDASITPELSQHEAQLQLQVRANPVA